MHVARSPLRRRPRDTGPEAGPPGAPVTATDNYLFDNLVEKARKLK
jgi:hypothetical protein